MPLLKDDDEQIAHNGGGGGWYGNWSMPQVTFRMPGGGIGWFPSVFNFPVGPTYNPVDWTGGIIPELVSGTTVAATLGVPGEIDRRDTPSYQEELLVWSEVSPGLYTVEGFGGTFTAAQMMGNFQIDVGSPTGGFVASDTEESMGWYSDLDEQFFGGMLPGGAEPGTGGFAGMPGYGFGGPATVGPGGAAPTPTPAANGAPMPPQLMAGCAVDDPWKGCVYKRVCGQWRWVKQKRRRRRQLFTQRDAAQMSSLMGSLPPGAPGVSIAKTWIATHPS